MATESIPIITSDTDFVKRHRTALPPAAPTWLAFYSSITNTIVTDPTYMVIPVDDHMVHRGHSIFDTCSVINGRIYGLEFHLDRLVKSATLSKIPLYAPREKLKNIIVQTIRAAKREDSLIVRYWLSIGRGGFGVSSKECCGPTFYVVATTKTYNPTGLKVYTTQIAVKPRLLATIKSTNYMLNALVQQESEAKGGDCGLWVDQDGYVLESSVMNAAFLDSDNVFRTPPFEGLLAGTTIKRVLERHGKVSRVEVGRVHINDARKCKEMMLLGGGYIYPVVKWDDTVISNGQPGPVFKAIQEILFDDFSNPEHSEPIYPIQTKTIQSRL